MTQDVFKMEFARIYPLWVNKVEKKGRSQAELDEVIAWLTGYAPEGLAEALADGRDLESFFALAPALSPNRHLIKGVVCGVRVEEIDDPVMREIRYLDKLVDELARGKALAKILRS